MPHPAPLSDDARFPALPASRRGLLKALREHPRAPKWNMACGDRLTEAHLVALRTLAAQSAEAWAPGEIPSWLADYYRKTRCVVPFYKNRTPPAASFFDLPTFHRRDLAGAPWDFVPDNADLSEILVYPTSGTTGPRFDVYSHPIAASATLPFLERALARVGVALSAVEGKVSLASVHMQVGTYTYPSLMSYLDGAGFLKLNLAPSQWRDPADIVAFLDEHAPDVYLGDPWSLHALSRLPLRSRPSALVSSATTLHDGLRLALQAHFGAPVLDLYSLTEARLLGLSYGAGHEILAPDIYVEILDPAADTPVLDGARGEVVVSGGCNPLLPLLRYRTGDFARLVREGGRMILADLEGRPPVCLLDAAGQVVNTIDVSRALSPMTLLAFHLHQAKDRALTLAVRGTRDDVALRLAIDGLFPGLPLSVVDLPISAETGAKTLQYSSAVAAPPSFAAVFGGAP